MPKLSMNLSSQLFPDNLNLALFHQNPQQRTAVAAHAFLKKEAFRPEDQ